MNAFAKPLIVLLLLYVIFFASLFSTIPELPDRVATHFGGSGRADGWMSQQAYMRGAISFGLGLPLLFVAIFFLLRFVPVSALNMPNREYWFSPERRAQSFDWLLRHSLWFASLSVLFLLGIHLSVLDANRAFPPRLSNAWMLGITGSYLAGMLLWIIVMVRHITAAPKRDYSTESNVGHSR